ncbi:MAG: hemolysin family protein, partial [Acidobacteriota bacterium]
MSPSPALALTLVVAALGSALLFATLAALLERSSHIRISHWAEHAGDRMRRLYESRRHFEAFRYLLTVVSRLLGVGLLALAWWLLAGSSSQPWAAPLAVVVALVGIELFTRWTVRAHAETSLRALTPVYIVLRPLAWPLIWALAPILAFAEDGEDANADGDEDEASDDEIDAYIDVGRREGILEPQEEELVRSIVDFGDTHVRSIMTPRVEIQSAPVDADLETLAAKFFESKNTRLPMYQESIDHVVGVLHIRDLFEAVHTGQTIDAKELSQQPYHVPEGKPLPELLAELQERHQQMAIVVDEYGGVAGLVTVEDLVEEIVGEIRDEHEPRPDTQVLDIGRWRLSGRMHLEDFEDLVEVDLSADELPYETLSGLICGELG